MVEIIEPHRGTVFDPACGSGGMFVQSAKFIDQHRHELANGNGDLFVYGQEKTLETVKLAKMNLAVNGLRGDILQANTYYEDPFKSFGHFDYVLTNPPFNVDDVSLKRVEGDKRFNSYGIPRKKTKAKKKDQGNETVPNANYLWINLFATSLKPKGRAALVMANSASDARHSEADIRKNLIESYHSQVIRDDIRDEFAVRQVDTMEALYFLLSECVGNPFSAANHSRTLKISHKTVSSWITVFERFFLVFKIRPYSMRISRSLVKEPKIYFYDYCRVQDEALRFENMVAVELNRAVTLWNDFGLGEYKIWYLRNKEKEEVDFLITENANPLCMIEAKLSDTDISPHLVKFQNILRIPAIQLVNKKNVARKVRKGSATILVASASDWLSCLN